MRRDAFRRGVATAAVTCLLTGCGAGASEDGEQRTVTVLAAASLTGAFTEIGRDFEAAHPGASVRFSFAGSSSLAAQINRGAPADVFASADTTQMRPVVQAGLVADGPVVFARNRLQIVVPAGNPGQVTSLAAFAEEDLTIALCAEEVPCGAAAREAFAVAGVTPAPDTLEQDVKAVLTKVALDEVDAGLVYVTDVASAGEAVEGVAFPEADRVVNDYPIAVLADAPNPSDAAAFTEYVLSEEGVAVLDDHGFVTEGP